jgi:hypothetical protein
LGGLAFLTTGAGFSTALGAGFSIALGTGLGTGWGVGGAGCRTGSGAGCGVISVAMISRGTVGGATGRCMPWSSANSAAP